MNLSEYVREQLHVHRGDLVRIGREVGVSRRTLGYLLTGNRDTRSSIVQRLADYFRARNTQ